jgi:3-hydroxy acid dehydrogenase / malonic semialdehyde reductase
MRGVKRTILVTGASSGIGRAVARMLLNEGHTVIGTARDCAKFNRAHSGFHPYILDLSQLQYLPAKILALPEQFTGLDGVVFCAGAGLFGSLEEFSYNQIQDSINLNFTSVAIITRALIPVFKRKPRSDLIYIGSEAALKGSRKGTIYCAGKFALRGFTQALREECGKDNVRVCLINPGMVRTPFFDGLSFSPGPDERNYLLPEEVADAVTYVINSRATMSVDEINLNPATKVISKK